MLFLPAFAAISASFGWASGIVLAQWPARQLGAFEFTRIQLIACAAIMATLVSALGYRPSIQSANWPSFVASSVIGIVLGNLAMIACLRRGGPRRTELLLSLKAPIVGAMAFLWLNETPQMSDLIGATLTLSGVGIAVAYGSDARSESDVTYGNLITIIGLGVIATACQGFGFLVMKPAMLAGTEPLAASALRLLGAAFLISIESLWPDRAFRPQTTKTPYLLGRTILPGFIGYGISSTLLLYAFATMDAGIAAVLGALSPVLVLPILWLKEGLVPRLPSVLGAVLAVLGSALIILL
jgi:drug/metabolite transporter (DMT)-like permease